jgi:hydrogenase expression/formation protein HypC
MCVTRPAEVLDVEGATARVVWQGQPLRVDLSLVGPVAPGEYLLVHAGLALEKVDRDEAAGLTALLAEWADLTAPGAPVSTREQAPEGERDA